MAEDASRGVALVTGASRGIGRAIAERLGDAGWDVAVNYRSREDAALEVVEAIEGRGSRAVAARADVGEPDGAAQLVQEVERRLGPVDVLVNNVGEFFFKPLGAMTHDEWRAVIDSNLSSAFYSCLAVLPGMRARRRGRIVNIGLSPVYLVRAAANVAAYAIAKTGVVVMAQSMAVEEASFGITVNCVSPGLIDNGYLPPEQAEWMEKRVPMGRLGSADEVADAVEYLVSERASYVSGANLTVSGGWDWTNRPTDHDGDVTSLFMESAGG